MDEKRNVGGALMPPLPAVLSVLLSPSIASAMTIRFCWGKLIDEYQEPIRSDKRMENPAGDNDVGMCHLVWINKLVLMCRFRALAAGAS